jgi:hypothetical protein
MMKKQTRCYHAHNDRLMLSSDSRPETLIPQRRGIFFCSTSAQNLTAIAVAGVQLI